MIIDHGGDMEILMGIDAADDKGTSGALRVIHCSSPDEGMPWRSRRHRMHVQDSNATERQALLGSHAMARRKLAAKGAGAADSSRERHGGRSIGVRVRPSRHLAAPAILDWPIAVGQAA